MFLTWGRTSAGHESIAPCEIPAKHTGDSDDNDDVDGDGVEGDDDDGGDKMSVDGDSDGSGDLDQSTLAMFHGCDHTLIDHNDERNPLGFEPPNYSIAQCSTFV